MSVGRSTIVALAIFLIDDSAFQPRGNADGQFNLSFTRESQPFIEQGGLILWGNDIRVREVYGVMIKKHPVELMVASRGSFGEAQR
jgi:hypothetical protein